MGGDQAAVVEAGVGDAVVADPAQVRLAARRSQDGEAACGKAEGADAVGVDRRPAGPVAQQIVDQDVKLARALGHVGRPALVAPVVARMGQGGDDEARLGQGARRRLMAAEIAAVAVGNDDQGASGAAVCAGRPDPRLDRRTGAVRDLQTGEGDGGLGRGCGGRRGLWDRGRRLDLKGQGGGQEGGGQEHVGASFAAVAVRLLTGGEGGPHPALRQWANGFAAGRTGAAGRPIPPRPFRR